MITEPVFVVSELQPKLGNAQGTLDELLSGTGSGVSNTSKAHFAEPALQKKVGNLIYVSFAL